MGTQSVVYLPCPWQHWPVLAHASQASIVMMEDVLTWLKDAMAFLIV